MHTSTALQVAAAATAVSAVSSLSNVCTSDYVTSVLPTAAGGIPQGITIDTESLVISSW